MATRRNRKRLPPRGAGGRFLKRSFAARKPGKRRTYAARSRRRDVAVAIANPRRRRAVSRGRIYKRHYRHNPILGGLGMDTHTLKSTAYVVGGVVGTPFLEGFVNQFVPASITSNAIGKYAIKIASALGLSFIAGKLLGKETGKLVAIGGFAYVGVSALKDFMPSMFGATTLSGVGYQPQLGLYPGGGMGSRVTAQIPDRLRPESRF